MSFRDKVSKALGQAKGRAGQLADEHGDKVDQAIDKGGRHLDQHTGGKYSDKIQRAADAAKGAAANLGDQHGDDEQGTPVPGEPEKPTPRAGDPAQPADPVAPTDGPPPSAPHTSREDLGIH